MTAPRVSCVVVAFHRPRLLARLLAAMVDENLEVIVVNVEDDDEVRQVVETSSPTIHVAFEHNKGYAAAVNRGAQVATAPAVLFCNDDVVVTARAAGELADALRAHDVAVPALVDESGELSRTIAALPSPWTLLKEWALLPDRPVPVARTLLPVEKWREPSNRQIISAATAAVVVAKASVLRDHPLPEDYFLYWEESEWFVDLAAAGLTTVYLPEVRCIRPDGRTQVSELKCRLLAENAVRCVWRTRGRGAARLAGLVVVVWTVRLLTLDFLRGRGADRLAARRAGLRAAMRACWRTWTLSPGPLPGVGS